MTGQNALNRKLFQLNPQQNPSFLLGLISRFVSYEGYEVESSRLNMFAMACTSFPGSKFVSVSVTNCIIRCKNITMK